MPAKLKTVKHHHKSTQAEHHLSLRKRSGQLDFSFIDHLIVFSGPLIPIAVFIQVYDVWILSKGDGLSVVTWSILLFASLTMAIYAVYHRIKPLILTYIPLVIANGLVVLGIVVL